MFEDATTTNVVSLGGVAVGLSIIVWTAVRWWKTSEADQREWQELVFPFLPLFAYGMLLILSAGGVLGSTASVALWGSNEIGRVALEEGVGSADVDATRTNNIVLSEGGHMVVLLMTVAFVAYLVFSEESRKNRKNQGWIKKIITVVRVNLVLIMPVVAGVCLGLSSGMAGWAAQGLGPAVDTLGASMAGVF